MNATRRLFFVGCGIAFVVVLLLALARLAPEPPKVQDHPKKARPKPDLPTYFVSGPEWFDLDLSAIPEQGWLMIPQPRPKSVSAANVPTNYLGAAACAECHTDIYESFVETSHHNTSAVCDPAKVLGSLESGDNLLTTSAPGFSFEMRNDGGKFIQRLRSETTTDKVDFPVDIIFGSGKRAQTFAFWIGNDACQSHVSYFTESDQWVNSPGYKDGTADFSRPIRPRCFSCHITYIEWLPSSYNSFVPETAIYGISCERCHGPGKEHVAFHNRGAGAAQAKDPIVNPQTLAATRQLDICSQCHAGPGESLAPSFRYVPGDDLRKFVNLSYKHTNVEGGVHTDNQAARLLASKCFTESSTMTCTTCHDPHAMQRGSLALFSKRCLTCHQEEHCRFPNEPNVSLKQHCVDCHMPNRRDQGTRMEVGESVKLPLLRDHLIQVSREATAVTVKSLSNK